MHLNNKYWVWLSESILFTIYSILTNIVCDFCGAMVSVQFTIGARFRFPAWEDFWQTGLSWQTYKWVHRVATLNWWNPQPSLSSGASDSRPSRLSSLGQLFEISLSLFEKKMYIIYIFHKRLVEMWNKNGSIKWMRIADSKLGIWFGIWLLSGKDLRLSCERS